MPYWHPCLRGHIHYRIYFQMAGSGPLLITPSRYGNAGAVSRAKHAVFKAAPGPQPP